MSHFYGILFRHSHSSRRSADYFARQDKTRQDKIIYVFECYHLSYCCGQISPYDNDAGDDENDDDDNDNENNNNNKTVQNPCQ